MNIKNLGRKEKELLAKRFNTSVGTIYNWEKDKPELIKIIELGLKYENLQKKDEIITKNKKDEYDEKVDLILKRMEFLEEEMRKIKENDK